MAVVELEAAVEVGAAGVPVALASAVAELEVDGVVLLGSADAGVVLLGSADDGGSSADPVGEAGTPDTDPLDGPVEGVAGVGSAAAGTAVPSASRHTTEINTRRIMTTLSVPPPWRDHG